MRKDVGVSLITLEWVSHLALKLSRLPLKTSALYAVPWRHKLADGAHRRALEAGQEGGGASLQPGQHAVCTGSLYNLCSCCQRCMAPSWTQNRPTSGLVMPIAS